MKIAQSLDKLNLLTDNCLAAIDAADPNLLLALMSDRQACMDYLDAARANGYNYCNEDYIKLAQLQNKDQTLTQAAEKLNSHFRQALKSVRSQQVYARISGNSGGNIV